MVDGAASCATASVAQLLRTDPEPARSRLLVVEDDADLRLLIRTALEGRGWVVAEAATAHAGRAVAREFDPDVVLLDLGLPDADGRAVLAALKGDEATAWVPVVVVSARAAAREATALLTAGAQDYVVKPFALDELQARVEAARRVAVEHRRMVAEREQLILTQQALEVQLTASQQLRQELQLLADTSNDMVVRTGLDDVVLYVSPSAEVLLGWQPDAIVGTRSYDWIHPDDVQGFTDLGSQALKVGDAFRVEFRLRARDGRWVWCETVGSLIVDPVTGEIEVRHSIRDISQRRAAEDALAASEEKYRRLVDDVAEGILRVDADDTIVFANPAMAELLDTSPAELIGRRWFDFVDGDATLFPADWLERRSGGEQDRFESSMLTATGRRIVVEVNAARVAAPDGSFSGAVALVSDVTAARAAEQALAASEAKYRRLVDLAAEGIWTIDPHGVVTFANRAMADMLGRTPDAIVGRPVCEFVPPTRHDSACPLLGAGAPVPRLFETELADAAGRPVEVRVAATPLHDPDGRDQGVLALVSDITSLKVQQRATQVAEARYRSAFEAAPVGMVQADLDGRCVEVNQAFCEMLGYAAGELVGRPVAGLAHPEEETQVAQTIATLAAGRRGIRHAERRYLHADGHVVWVSVSDVAVRDHDGNVSHVLIHYLDISERKRFEHQLQHLVDHDPLTGLLNRRGFEIELDRQAARVARYGTAGALLVLDLDHFKQVNDTLGHNAGDELIVAMGDLLREHIRDTDVIARLGGDEFAVILPYAEPADAEAVADKIIRAVRERVVVLSGQHARRVTTSIGIAQFDDQLTGQDVLVNADLSMYDAKEAGRNRYSIHHPDAANQPQTKSRLAWVDRINDALDNDRFVLYAQPILDLRTRKVDRYELLVRMVDRVGDTVAPGAFLHVAERVGLIDRIDRWVTETAVALLADRRLDRDIALEVNLSGRSLANADLLDYVERLVRRSQVDPTRLVFEVTETAAVANIHLAREFAHRLSAIGCHFALDDFGAGFGSFYYLKHLPFDYLKIDGEFVTNCTSTPTDRLVIDAVVSIARGLEKHTIAEFVGDEATVQFLCDHGVDFAQGYHIGVPVPVETLFRPADVR